MKLSLYRIIVLFQFLLTSFLTHAQTPKLLKFDIDPIINSFSNPVSISGQIVSKLGRIVIVQFMPYFDI